LRNSPIPPFLKVEASKFTEVGYVGRDVEAMIRDLVDISIDMVREERIEEVAERAERNAEERLLDLLMPPQPEASESAERTREKLREKLRAGKLDDRMVEIDVRDRGPTFEISTGQGMEEMDVNLKDVLPGLFGQRTRKRKMRVAEAAEYLVQEEEQKLIDMDQVTRVALERVERNGIIFLDEIDKIAGRESGHGPDVSREGVQRDILPIVEGTTVNTRHGFVRTDHILFVAAGAFHVSKPSDLIPELQGRFPIRVELKSLTEADFIRILREPKNALVKQYTALLETEGIKLTFTDDAVEEISGFAARVNSTSENIGARRLHTIMEKMLEEISFAGPDLKKKNVKIDAAYVRKQLADIVKTRISAGIFSRMSGNSALTVGRTPGPRGSPWTRCSGADQIFSRPTWRRPRTRGSAPPKRVRAPRWRRSRVCCWWGVGRWESHSTPH